MDFGQDAEGTLYLAMEYIEGRDLADVLDNEWPIPEQRVVHIMSQILSALGAAHALGIVHRDLKPENVLVRSGPDGDEIKVCDFGIAQLSPIRLARADAPAQSVPLRVTGDGMVVGTPAYMSPEQARARTLDARSDIYSAGVVLFQLLTRTLPFVSDTPMGVAVMHCTTPPPPPSGFRPVNRALELVCLKALSKTREARYQSALEMRNAIHAALQRPRLHKASGRKAIEAQVELARRASSPNALSILPTERIAGVPSTPIPKWSPLRGRSALVLLLGACSGALIWVAVPRLSGFEYSRPPQSARASSAAPVRGPALVARSQPPSAADPSIAHDLWMPPPQAPTPSSDTITAPAPSEVRPVSVLALASRAPRAPRELVRARKTDTAIAPVEAAYASDAPSVEVAASVTDVIATEAPASSDERPADPPQPAAASAAPAPATVAPPPKQQAPAPKPQATATPTATAVTTTIDRASAARVVIGAARSGGGVPKASIRGALNQAAINHCYAEALRKGDAPRQPVDAQLELATNMGGHIVSARVQGDLPKALRECIEQVARTGRMRDADTGEASVSVTLNLLPQ
jgi:serine/threonine-protein kinase